MCSKREQSHRRWQYREKGGWDCATDALMSQKTFFAFQRFGYHASVETMETMPRWSMMKNIHSPNLVGIGSWGPEIWPHEYLLSPIEISVNRPGSKQLWTSPIITLISMGLIRYSCGHILGHHEPIHVKFGVWRFFITLYRNMVMKMLKCKKKKKIDDVTLQYSITTRLYKTHITTRKLYMTVITTIGVSFVVVFCGGGGAGVSCPNSFYLSKA